MTMGAQVPQQQDNGVDVVDWDTVVVGEGPAKIGPVWTFGGAMALLTSFNDITIEQFLDRYPTAINYAITQAEGDPEMCRTVDDSVRAILAGDD